MANLYMLFSFTDCACAFCGCFTLIEAYCCPHLYFLLVRTTLVGGKATLDFQTTTHCSLFRVCIYMAQPFPGPSSKGEAISVQSYHLDRVNISKNKLGKGAYAKVYEAEVSCAAKVLHDVLTNPKYPRNLTRFQQECSILYQCVHPNIVRFFGLSTHPKTGRTVLLMELMNETLTDFLQVRYRDQKLPYYLQINVSQDIAKGVKYLHDKCIVHRDLSSNNVLLKCSVNAQFMAKISDFGVSRMIDGARQTPMTQCPGTAVYMPPEVLLGATTPKNVEEAKKIDTFQLGVLMLQIATKQFPNPTDANVPCRDPHSQTGYSSRPIPEEKRREEHLNLLKKSNPELGWHDDHPLLDDPILKCLKDKPMDRLSAGEVLSRLNLLMDDRRYCDNCKGEGVIARQDLTMETTEREENRLGASGERVHQLESECRQLQEQLDREETERHRLREQVDRLERERQELRRESAGRMQALEENNRQLHEQLARARQQLQTTEQEKYMIQDQISQLQRHGDSVMQLQRENQQLNVQNQQLNGRYTQQVEAFQHQLKESQAREQQAIHAGQQMVQQEATRIQIEIANLRQQLKKKNEEIERMIARHSCRIIAGFKRSITTEQPTSIDVELCDAAGEPCNLPLNTLPTACLLSQSTPPQTVPPFPCDIKPLEKRGNFQLYFELSQRGQYSLKIQLGGKDIQCHDNATLISVYPHPTSLRLPRRFITGVKRPLGVAVSNRRREILISESNGGRVVVYDIDDPKQVKRVFDKNMLNPVGVAVDDEGYVYVTSEHKLLKFCGETGQIVEYVGEQEGDSDLEFDSPLGLAIHHREIYISDQKNGRIQVFNFDLNFVRSILADPNDVAFDDQGRMYVAEYKSSRVVVMTTDGNKQLQVIDLVIGGARKIKPQAIHIINEYLYVSDVQTSTVSVFHTASGKYITSLGRRGHEEGEWFDPRGITSFEGKIYICGSEDGNVHFF